MKTLFLIFSHTLTPEQVLDAEASLGVSEFIGLPPDLQTLFSQVPADLESLQQYLRPIFNWIDQNASDNDDYVLIQGDFGATYLLVDYCKTFGYAIPIYATTERAVINETQEDGSVTVQRIFRHKRFRKY